MTERSRWVVLIVRLAAQPSRHRVAVWRELRRIGALSLGQGAWALPDLPGFGDGIQRVTELARRGNGDVVALESTGRAEQDDDRLREWFTTARHEEWREFLSGCAEFDAMLDGDVQRTPAELDDEEHGLERLRRWFRELKARDVFGCPAADEAEERLDYCAERLENNAMARPVQLTTARH
jgi:hypothetical protein